MDELIKALLALPEMPLTSEECDWLTDLLATLPSGIRSATGFTQAIGEFREKEQVIPLNDNKIEALTLYLDAWYPVVNMIIEKNNAIKKIWSRLTGEDVMPNDALFPLLIEMLPDETAILTTLIEKLNQGMRVELNSGISYYILNLSAAMIAKPQPSMKANKENEVHWAVIMMMLAEMEVDKLEMACDTYKQYLLTTFMDKLRLDSPAIFAQYYENNTAADNVKTLSLVDAIKEGKLILSEELTHLLIQKYLMLFDMHYRLAHPETTPQEKLQEFSKKFPLFETWLPKKEESWGYLSLSLWAPVPTPETKFTDIASVFVNRVREYEEYCEKKSRPFSHAM